MSFAHLERNCASSAVAATTQILNFEAQKNYPFVLSTPNIDLSVVSSEGGHKTTSLVSSLDDV